MSLDPGSVSVGKIVDIRGKDEVGATWVNSAGECVAVKMGIVPVPGKPVAVRIVPTVGLVVYPGV